MLISVPFDASAARAMLAPGDNAIHGNAFMRQRGGGVVTCAGETVNLIPAAAYATERIAALYGNTSGGAQIMGRRFQPDVPEYELLIRHTRCDSRGDFAFEKVADGDFFVQTAVRWQVGEMIQGGGLFQHVHLTGGRDEKIILAS